MQFGRSLSLTPTAAPRAAPLSENGNAEATPVFGIKFSGKPREIDLPGPRSSQRCVESSSSSSRQFSHSRLSGACSLGTMSVPVFNVNQYFGIPRYVRPIDSPLRFCECCVQQ